MTKEESIQLGGVVVESLPCGTFVVELDMQKPSAENKSPTSEPQKATQKSELKSEHKIKARRSGRMVKNRIRVLKGDKVTVQMTLYDLTKGIIMRIHKDRIGGSAPQLDKSKNSGRHS